MTVLAVCAPEKPNWAMGALVIVIALVLYVLPIGAAFKTAPSGTRRWLALVYVAGIGISVLFGFVLPNGLASDADYLGLFLGGLVIGAGCGVIGGFLKPRAGSGVMRWWARSAAGPSPRLGRG